MGSEKWFRAAKAWGFGSAFCFEVYPRRLKVRPPKGGGNLAASGQMAQQILRLPELVRIAQGLAKGRRCLISITGSARG